MEKEKRRLAKVVNFAIAYNVGAFGLAQRTGLTRKAAKEAIENYLAEGDEEAQRPRGG